MIFIDVHEPSDAVVRLSKFIPATVGAFNVDGTWHSDYHWQCNNGQWVEVERKQWMELSDMDGVEEQLYRHMRAFPQARHVLLIEGLAVPNHNGLTVLKRSGNPKIWIETYSLRRPPSAFYSKLYQINRFMEIVYSSSWDETVSLLHSMYTTDQKEYHNTFARNYAKVTYNPNPQVSILMGMMPGLGEVRASALIREFNTVWNVLNASVKELTAVRGIGETIARGLLRGLGRPDV